MDIESLERHNANVQVLLANRRESDIRWRNTFLTSLAELKKAASREKNAIRVRAENMPLRTFEYRESRRRSAVNDICDALGNAKIGWENKKITVAVAKTMKSLNCKF